MHAFLVARSFMAGGCNRVLGLDLALAATECSKIFANGETSEIVVTDGRTRTRGGLRNTGQPPATRAAGLDHRGPSQGTEGGSMPVADHAVYCEMLDRARKGGFAYPAINVTSLTTANAVLKGLADSKSDGIIQVSTGGGAFASAQP